MNQLELHPLARCVPPMTPVERDRLLTDIAAEPGGGEPLVLLDGRVLGGVDRYQLCVEQDLPYRTRRFDPSKDGEPVAFVHACQADRNLNPGQRAAMVLRMDEWVRKEQPALGESRADETCAAFAKRCGVSEKTCRFVLKIRHQASAELFDAVANGVLTAHEAWRYRGLPSDLQRQIALIPSRRERDRLVHDLTLTGESVPARVDSRTTLH